jgi:hypothetical protein
MGISHIPDPASGIRFDLSVFPALYRRGFRLPNVNWESGYHPWEAAPDLSYYRHRHEMIWRDQVYADVDFCRIDDAASLVWVTCVNSSSAPQNLALHWVAALYAAPQGGRGSGPLRRSQVILPEGGVWTEGLSYEVLALGHQAHRANLSYDGQKRGEVRVNGFVEGLGLGQGFGLSEGDAVIYRVDVPRFIPDATIVLRYRMPENTRLRLEVPGLLGRAVTLRGKGAVRTREIPLHQTLRGEVMITLAPTSAGPPLEIDGFAIVPVSDLDDVQFEPLDWNPVPRRLDAPREDTLVLAYDSLAEQCGNVYGLAWGATGGERVPYQLRELFCDDLDTTMQLHVHEHVRHTLWGPGSSQNPGHFTNLFQRPIFLEPESRLVMVGLICYGGGHDVREKLDAFDSTDPKWQAVHHDRRSRAVGIQLSGSSIGLEQGGGPGQARMAATLATNVVYPVRTRGTWIRHYTPGRWWDSLYTWDSGFIGLGLAELDLDRALDNLNAYLTVPGTQDAAFIHHGTPLPTQFYVFRALWDRTQDPALLDYFYPRLQQYHRFLAGRLGSSNTRTLGSGLIRTWDYFYNSGGWDDYPAQVHVHRHGLQDRVTPVVSTAHVIRTAKILRAAALALGEPAEEYEEDIAVLSSGLQKHAWDEDAGYFSYVVHDSDGAPLGPLRHASGANYNMGLDGVSPLVAGVCTPEQEARLADRLTEGGRLWSRSGLSTVDQAAPYYRDDGYWNGAVWMPHQWFFWKALLDLGRTDQAHHIAATALDLWDKEVRRSYNCYEHFILRTGRGAGWHHFGGLSSPVLCWHGAYHVPGRLTVGLDMWIEGQSVSADQTRLSARLQHLGADQRTPSVIAALAPGDYVALWNGTELPTQARYPGTLEIRLPRGARAGELEVLPANGLGQTAP